MESPTAEPSPSLRTSSGTLEQPTLVENVLSLAVLDPTRIFAKLQFARAPEKILTYGQLMADSRRYAALLRERGIGPGDVVIIILGHGAPLLGAFIGAALLRAIPSIFAFPSSKMSPESYRATLPVLVTNCRARCVFTDSALAREIDGLGALPEGVPVLTVEQASDTPPLRDLPSYQPDDLALLQHSSGTTGLKKGVALSNRAVLQQLRHYAEAIALSDGDRIVSWLPLYHDMGLIACFLLPLASGVPLVLLSPFEWVARPVSLLEAIHRERATLCWLPNFAYAFLASRVRDQELSGLRLDSMRLFINCSEPITPRAHLRFADRFQPAGLAPSSLGTCYAMAENTYAVTQSPPGRAAPIREIDEKTFQSEHRAVDGTGRQLVSSGRVIAGNEVRILSDEGQALPEGRVGEIAVRSDSLFEGYYLRPELTAAALREGWYHTGDIGLLLDGELYVTARKKDLIIVAGKNIYPQDIEEAVSSVPGVHPGRVVAFGDAVADLETEHVVVLAETTQTDPAKLIELRRAILLVVRERLECVVNDLRLLPHQWLVKSSSGKIARNANRQRYLETLKRKPD